MGQSANDAVRRADTARNEGAEVPTAAQFGLWALTFGFAFALSIHEIYAERRGWELRP